MLLHGLRGRQVCFCHLLEISTWHRQISRDTKEKVCASIYISAACRRTGVERSRTQHVKLQETRGKLNSMFCSGEAGAAATPFFSIGAEMSCFHAPPSFRKPFALLFLHSQARYTGSQTNISNCAVRYWVFTASSNNAHAFGTGRKFGHKTERSKWVKSWKSFKFTLFHHKGTRGAF